MEFPDLGENCSEVSCKLLDFLPMKCDECLKIFCKDHIMYSKHSCPSAFKKDVQVPVCPLCNTPIPVKRGQSPDIPVSQHIDNDCMSDPAKAKRGKIYFNKCSLKGCKQKELVPVRCDSCQSNFCLKHRLEQDHKCSGPKKSVNQSGAAALGRLNSKAQNKATSKGSCSRSAVVPNRNANEISTFQVGMTDDQALAAAMRLSMGNSQVSKDPQQASTNTTQEEEDQRLAQAIADSEQDFNRRQHSRNNTKSTSSCVIS